MDFADWLAVLMPVVLGILMMTIIENYQRFVEYLLGRPFCRLPLHKRIHRRLLLLLNSRVLYNFEHDFEFDSETREVESSFYVARKPIVIEVHLSDPAVLAVDRLMYQSDGEWHTGSFGGRILKRKDLHVVEIYPADPVLMDRIKVRFPDIQDQYLQKLRIRTTRRPHKDADLFLRATSASTSGETEEAINLYQEYRKRYSPLNPWATTEITKLYHRLKRYDEAGEYAIRTLVNGRSEWGFATYAQIQEEIPFIDMNVVEELRDQGKMWKSKSPRGAVVLKREQNFLLGLDNWYLKKFREVFEIRRPVAARRLTHIYFPFDSGDGLLFSNLRVIHPDGEIEVVPDVHFSVQDSGERVTHREKMGVWILPDLSVGDIVEWSFHLLIREDIPINDLPHFFIATLLQSRFYPTLNSDTTFRYPVDWKLSFVRQNEIPALKSMNETEGEWQSATFHIDRHTPTWGTGFYYETYRFNPSVACGWESHRWDEVTNAMLEHQFGKMDIDDEIPAPLIDILEQHPEPEEALRQGFYWLRDKLKYRPFDWAELVRAHEGWAGEIIESGVANCREKSYLLHQICRKLGIRSELVVIPSDRGLIFEELPSNQFNHVMVRVEVGDDWHYLDATYTGGVFTSAPDGYQGLRALVLDETGTMITIPEVDPERNRVVISETFDELDGDWLAGHFSYRAEGNIARLADEYWKGITIHGRGHRHSAQEAFRNRFPALILREYTRTSNTAHSDVLELTGSHKRCHLSSLSGKRVGIIEWDESTLPFDYWEALHPAGLFVFPMPLTLDTTLTIAGNLFTRMADVSEEVEHENDFCRISEERRRENDRLQIRRKIVIKRKFVSGEHLRELPATMQILEKAMQVAVSFNG